ncbi:MAG: phosphatidate cytidylyltransferase [Chloroflexi bacterium]|nr:phosphatidate cytidylyltransferase [Chloroflexota bacterium]
MLGDLAAGFGLFAGYFVVAASLLLALRAVLAPPREVFRKMLHLICVMSVLVLVNLIDTWYIAAAVALLFGLTAYVAIWYVERHTDHIHVLMPRRRGEIRSSLVIVFLMMAVLIAIFWGWMGEEWKYIVVVAVMTWGYGDAAAALVGKAVGRHPIRHPWVEGAKTREGSIAMWALSAGVLLVSLMRYTAWPWYLCLVCALLVAPICALVELVSHDGLDTITVPFAAAIPTVALLALYSLVGG